MILLPQSEGKMVRDRKNQIGRKKQKRFFHSGDIRNFAVLRRKPRSR